MPACILAHLSRYNGSRMCATQPRPSATAVLTGLALIAFAANSILCRLALIGKSIDAASFSTIRIVSGAIALLTISALTSRRASARAAVRWRSALLLFSYVVGFSFAYIVLPAGSGTLILFGSVQITMIVAAFVERRAPTVAEWTGLLLGLTGLILLVSLSFGRDGVCQRCAGWRPGWQARLSMTSLLRPDVLPVLLKPECRDDVQGGAHCQHRTHRPVVNGQGFSVAGAAAQLAAGALAL